MIDTTNTTKENIKEVLGLFVSSVWFTLSRFIKAVVCFYLIVFAFSIGFSIVVGLANKVGLANIRFQGDEGFGLMIVGWLLFGGWVFLYTLFSPILFYRKLRDYNLDNFSKITIALAGYIAILLPFLTLFFWDELFG